MNHKEIENSEMRTQQQFNNLFVRLRKPLENYWLDYSKQKINDYF